MLQPYDTVDKIYEFSIANPTYDYISYFKNSQKFNKYTPNILWEPLKRWSTPG